MVRGGRGILLVMRPTTTLVMLVLLGAIGVAGVIVMVQILRSQ